MEKLNRHARLKVLARLPEMDRAWVRFMSYHKKKKLDEKFWKWLGGDNYVENLQAYSVSSQGWWVTEEQYRKIEMLNSPYWYALMKAHECRNCATT